MAYNDRYTSGRDNRSAAPSIRDLATSIMVQQYNIDFNNPPSIPNIPIPKELDEVFPLICATVADTLTKSAEVTAAHLFLYNITAVDAFGNADFDDIVKAVVAAVDAVMSTTNPLPDINQVIVGVTRDVVDGAAAATANGNRELGGYVHDSEWRILDDAARAYDDLKRMMQPAQRGRGYSGGSRQSYTSSSNRQMGRPNRVGVTPPRQEPLREERPMRQSSGLSVNEAARRRSAPQTGRPQATRQEAPVAQPVIGETLHWRSTAKQPYLPAYNIVAKEEVLQATPEGVISVNKPRVTIMEDYNSHTTKMGPRAVYPDQKARNLQVDVALREAEAAAVTESIVLNAENLPVVYATEGLFPASLLLEHTVQYINGVRINGATSRGGVVYDSIIRTTDDTPIETYEWLSVSRTFEQLGQRIRMVLENSVDKFRLSGEQVRALDAQLTRRFNRILHRQLSVPTEVYIESFANDIDSLFQIFNESPLYKMTLPGLRLAERDFIVKNTFILSGQFRDCAIRNLEELMLPAPAMSDAVKSNVVMQGTPTITVLLRICADEMSLDIDVGQTKALIASEHRQLATLASTMVDMVNPITDTRSNVTLITLDRYVFELDKGLLGDHYYLVTRTR